MKKSIVFFFALISFAACDLTKLEPAQTKSFMKYFGDVGKTYGEDLLKLDDGYLLLGNNYANEDRQGHNFSVLIKTDMNGNTLWTQIHEDIEGRSLAKTGDGYFIVGDGINGTNSTMMLIKTDLQGSKTGEVTPLGNSTASYHGTALTISTTNEVVVAGYIESGNNNDSTFLYGYNTDLSQGSTWDQVRKYIRTTAITSRTLTEIDFLGQSFVFTELGTSGTALNATAYVVGRDAENTHRNPDLFVDFGLTSEIGDFSISDSRFAAVQTVNTGSGTGIAFSSTSESIEDQSSLIISPDEGNYTVNSVARTSDNNYVVLGSTDNTGDNIRQDTDYFIKKVGPDGTDISDGFTLSFGGTAEEYGTKIIEADDGGYVFIGTHENPNEVDFMVLVKITKDGKLIN